MVAGFGFIVAEVYLKKRGKERERIEREGVDFGLVRFGFLKTYVGALTYPNLRFDLK